MERRYQLLDFWFLAQRETIHRQFKEGNTEKNIANFEFLVRQSLFKMKIDRTPLFRAFLYNQLFDSPGSWREIRKIFRKFLIKIRKYQNLHSSVNFLEKLTPVFQEIVGWFQSQFITWGIVMPRSLMDDSIQSIDNLIQLFGVAFNQGYSEIVQPLNSAIIEKSTKICVDHMIFSPQSKESPGSDYFRLKTAHYIINNFNPEIVDWLFSPLNNPGNFNNVIQLMKSSFNVIFQENFDILLEELDDIGETRFSEFLEGDMFDLSEILLFAYWQTLSISQQKQLINKWESLEEFQIFINNLSIACPFIENLNIIKTCYSYLKKWGYNEKNENFKIEIQNIITKLNSNEEKQSNIIEYLESLYKIIPEIQSYTSEDKKIQILQSYNLGVKENAIKNIEEIINEKMITENADFKEIYNHILGNSYLYNHQYNLAIETYENILNTKEKLNRTYINYLICLMMLNIKEKYLILIENVLKSEFIGLGLTVNTIRDLFWDIFAWKGEYFVIELINDLIERNRINLVDLCIGFGHISADLGFFKTAINFNNKALEFHPVEKKKSTILNNIATVYSDWGKYEEAIDYFKKSLELDNSLVRTLINLGKLYSFQGEGIKAKECLEKAYELNKDRDGASFAEIYYSNYEIDAFGMTSEFRINYNLILSDAVKLHFSTADKLYEKIFPQNTEIQVLASSIFMHYGNGMELLFHDSLGIPVQEIMQNKEKQKIPRKLYNLIYNNHVGLGNWANIIEKWRLFPEKGNLKHYKKVVNHLSKEDLKYLEDAAKFIAKIRNPSGHGEIFTFEQVRFKKMELVFHINICIEIFSK